MITREELENLRRLAGEGDLRSQYKLDEMIPKVIDTALSLLDETDELKGKNELLIQTVEFQGKMFTKLEAENAALRKRVEELMWSIRHCACLKCHDRHIMSTKTVAQPPEEKP